MTAPRKTLAICADDFGQSPAIDTGILQLLGLQRLSAVSCLSGGASWPADAPTLLAAAGRAQLGLHFNLTEGRPLSAALAQPWPQYPSLPQLIARAHLRRLPLPAVRAELAAQIAAFVAAAGRAPDYIDGHQHIHALPGVRDLVLDAAATLRPLPALRSTAHLAGPGFALKRWLIGATGGRALGRALAARGLRHNRMLLGAYDFVQSDYGALMRDWLALAPAEGGLLFCHPGTAADDPADAIGPARVRELDYLAGSAFAADLAAAGVVVGAPWRVD